MARFGVDALWDADMSSSDGEDEFDRSPMEGGKATRTMATGEWDKLLKGTPPSVSEGHIDARFHVLESRIKYVILLDRMKDVVLDPSTSVDGASGGISDDEDMFEGGQASVGEEEEEPATIGDPKSTKCASGEPLAIGRSQPGAFAAYKPSYYDMTTSEATTGPSLLGEWPKLRHPYLQQHLSFRPSLGPDGRMAMPVEASLNRYRMKVLPVVPAAAESIDPSFVEQCFSALTSIEASEASTPLELFDTYRSYEGAIGVPRKKSVFALLSGLREDGAVEDLRPWLSDVNTPIPVEADPLERAFHQLIATDVTGATLSLQAGGYPRLARIAAILGFDSMDWESARSEDTVAVLRQQLDQWKLDSPGHIKGAVAAVYQLLAGEVDSEEVLCRCSSWAEKFAAYYCYGVKDDGGRYSVLDTVKAVGKGRGVEWELLRVQAGLTAPEELADTLLSNSCASPEPFTAFLAFLVYSSIFDVTLSSPSAARLASVTAHWLEAAGLWQWAALVFCEYLWIPSSSIRLFVTDLVYRNLPEASDAFCRTVMGLPSGDHRGTPPQFPDKEELLPEPVAAALDALLGEDDLNSLLWSAAAPRIGLKTRDQRLTSALCYVNAGDWRGAARVMDRELLTVLEDVILGGGSAGSLISTTVGRLAFLVSGSSGIDPVKDWIQFANAVLHDDVLTSSFVAKCKACTGLGSEKEALLREAWVGISPELIVMLLVPRLSSTTRSIPLCRSLCRLFSSASSLGPEAPKPSDATEPPQLLQRFTPRPFNPRFAYTSRPFFPICAKNMRNGHGRQVQKKKKKRVRGRGKSQRGIKLQHDRGMDVDPETWDGGNRAYYNKFPKWPGAKREMSSKYQQLETLSLARLRKFIEHGRLDTRYPITQRHLFESRCVKRVRNGVRLFNYNDYPFPYKVDIEVASVDQSSIDMLKRVGGSVTVVYMERIALRAHIKPWKFEVLPRTARPNLAMVHYMEKMRARGAKVRYIKPLWLLDEEQRVRAQLREEMAEEDIARETVPEITA
ncbi:Ribosomal protein [Perkinsus chesapeaki]|uniref:Ribosomal protein n=1 Tax=Perkinsus chesapeaki TaxID=330153 RepID=A0A7J6N2A6_PERCH|nr:Ribosomal protein [Perkinsus chesapeaki]